MLGALDSAEIEDILRKARLGRLGVYGEGRVHIVPINFGYDGAGVYVQSSEGLKVRLMRARPEVCFEVEDVISPARWRTVVAHGVFEELKDEAERDAAFALIAAQGREPEPPSLAPYAGGPEGIVVYRIRLTEKSGRYEHDAPFVMRGPPAPLGADTAATVQRAIAEALRREAENEARQVVATLAGRTATVSGTVHSWVEKRLIADAVAAVPGIETVVDQLSVHPYC